MSYNSSYCNSSKTTPWWTRVYHARGHILYRTVRVTTVFRKMSHRDRNIHVEGVGKIKLNLTDTHFVGLHYMIISQCAVQITYFVFLSLPTDFLRSASISKQLQKSPIKFGFDHRVVHIGSVMEYAALGPFLSKYFGFSPSATIPPMLITPTHQSTSDLTASINIVRLVQNGSLLLL
jgi:hypothetical protein